MGQDKWLVEEVFNKMKYGYFVDVGCYHPIDISNTYTLEYNFSWNGIAIDFVNTGNWSIRKCKHILACVSQKENMKVKYWGFGSGSGIVTDRYKPKKFDNDKNKTRIIKTRSLNSILIENNTPEIIHYLSIDTEGSELDILQVFDFNRFKPIVVTIEHNGNIDYMNKIRNFMKEKNYTLVKEFSTKRHIEDGFIANWFLKKSKANDIKSRILFVITDPNNKFIPRIPDAGKVINDCFIMHNGIKVVNDYYGNFIKVLQHNKGCHEPQEERVFQEILKYIPDNGVMIELGSYWAFYSMWFHQKIKNARCIMVEPKERCLNIGRKNFELNNMKGKFIQATIPIDISMDQLIKDQKIDIIHILHIDIQSAELLALKSAEESLKQKKIRNIFVSTHKNHLHKACKNLLKSHGYKIITSVDFEKETFCWDGVLVASLDKINPIEVEKANWK